jgi:tetratricopeptide (TPR) repeat protein
MANSIGRPRLHSAGTVQSSGGEIRISSDTAGMTHRLRRRGFTAEHSIDWFVGSGNQGRSYLVSLAGRLFQSPASYYSDRRSWGLSPGYEGDSEIDFDRPIAPECLFCHADRARPIAFSSNQYETPPITGAISCARCHGNGDAHAAHPSKENIVNPARLEPQRRDAICEQCHLAGEARIANPGRRLWDYQPGEMLEKTLTVYVADDSARAFQVVGHAEELAASKCAQQSAGRLWCGSCHDPHARPVSPAAYYRERCLRCHATAAVAAHAPGPADCAGCHMPRRQAYDGGHTAFTDHRILARPGVRTRAAEAPRKLRAWREPPAPLEERNLGLAWISVGERHGSAASLQEGFRRLAAVQSQFPDDAAVLTAFGAVLQRKGVPAEAAQYFARAAQIEPRDARHRLNLGIAWAEANRPDRAIAALEAAIGLDPLLRDAYVLLAEIYKKSGDREKRRRALERYLSVAPQSIVVRSLLTEP